MTIHPKFNSDQWIKNMKQLVPIYKPGYSTYINYYEVKKIFDFCVEDTRWINDPRLIPCKNSLYLKLEELMVTHKHNHQYVKCFNEIKIQLQCAEKGIVYMKTNPNIEANDEFEKLYGNNKIKEAIEFEKLYEEDEIKEANINYTKKIDLSTLGQYSISIASICPIVCRL